MGYAEDKVELQDEKAKVSYSIGFQMAQDLARQGIAIDADLVKRGMQDALSGSQPMLPAEEMRQALMEVRKKAMAAQQKQRDARAAQNKAQADAFLTANASKEGVKTLPSGLQYKVLQDGDGKQPGPSDSVTVHYRGTLINGKEFDSSYSRNQPATFQVNRVIKGWTEALQLMQEGAKWQLFIPPDLAYGERGAGANIPPNAALIFEVELISVAPGTP
jgi:FKBP-type peptidyl-prolyl cis-trans isomerase FklB